MPCQLPADCLNDIFDYLQDKVDLSSCLLVNRLWCEVSVPILWTNIQNYRTLIACLPNESKEILHENEIIISPPTSKPPLFNYVRFIKSFPSKCIVYRIGKILTTHQSIYSQNFENNKLIVLQEIFKMFMSQTSLKKLNFHDFFYIPLIPFTTYPGAMFV